MSTIKQYGNIRLPQELIDELKVWRIAFIRAYNRPMTYEYMLRGMLESLEDSDPAVHEEYCRLMEHKETEKESV